MIAQGPKSHFPKSTLKVNELKKAETIEIDTDEEFDAVDD